MKMTDIQKKAKALGMTPGKMSKTELVRSIQEREGNFACFQTAKDSCDQSGCCWRKDCLTH